MSENLRYEMSNVYQVYPKNLLIMYEQCGVERYESTKWTVTVAWRMRTTNIYKVVTSCYSA